MSSPFLYEQIAHSSSPYKICSGELGSWALYEVPIENSMGWSAYLLTSTSSSSSSLPSTISLEDSLLQQSGYYLFAVTRPPILNNESELQQFAEDALDYICPNTSGNINRVVVWLQNVAPVQFGNFANFGFKFNYNPLSNTFPLNSNLNVNLGQNLTFFVLQSVSLSVDGEAGQLVLSINKGSSDFIGFQKGDKEIGISVEGSTLQRAWIPVSGNNGACFVFSAELTPSDTFGATGFDQGFKYIAKDSNIYYPSFKTTALPQTLNCVGTVDPSDPVNTRLGSENLQQGYLRTGFGIAQPSTTTNQEIPEPEPLSGWKELLQMILNCLRKLNILPSSQAPELPTPLIPEVETTPEKIALNSYFRTPEGNVISLVPLGTEENATSLSLMAGALALASDSDTSTTEPGQGTVYFTLAGQFGLEVEGIDAGTSQGLLGGLFGSERLTFITYDATSNNNDTIFFLPSQAAYAPVFPFTTANLQSPDSGGVKSRLDSTYLTAWATLFAAQGNQVEYRAEPEGSPLYAAPSVTAPLNGDTLILNSVPPKMALAQGAQNTFPLVPYGGVSEAISGVDGTTLTQFASQIIGATRKTLISAQAQQVWQQRAAAQLQEDAQKTYSTTPQGLIAQIDSNSGAYFNVQLAQSTNRQEQLTPFAFVQPSQQVQDALQTNQLFLVAVNDEYFETNQQNLDALNAPTFENVLYITEWEMAAQIGKGATTTSYRNVMIFKFCEGTIQDRVTNPNRWTNPQDFSLLAGVSASAESLAYTGLSQWLQDYITTAQQRAAGDSGEFYQNFMSIVTDPLWTGVLVLEAELSADTLPPQIQGLAAGIDFSNFVAHHFGFTVSRVSVDATTGIISMQDNSSLFGLIDYEDGAYAANLQAGVDPNTPIPVQTSDDFDFTVLQLQSLFENANLVDFKSRIQLTVDRLFGSEVVQTYNNGVLAPANGVVLVGSYVEQNSAANQNSDNSGGSYVFQQTRSTVFTLDSNVLSAIAFNRVQFNTLGSRTVDDATIVASRFLVWGAFDFVELQDSQEELLDLLSFGSPATTEPVNLGKGLAFSNLVINMSFPQVTPNAKSFDLDPNNLAYDLNSSSPRDKSLFQGFGLQLKSFINASAEQTPADYGFLPVTSSLKLQSLEESWFGVVYNVTLGGPGALVSAAGFSSSLLVAWSPSTDAQATDRAVFLGLSLPGAAPGAQLFSLQGVFKVAVGSIALLRQAVPNGNGDFYCLRLDDVGLKILGITKLPPDATIQFFLFGDPNNTGSLGWYAAYKSSDSDSIPESATTNQALTLEPVVPPSLPASDSVPEFALQSPQQEEVGLS